MFAVGPLTILAPIISITGAYFRRDLIPFSFSTPLI
jgi:hypothetical protein